MKRSRMLTTACVIVGVLTGLALIYGTPQTSSRTTPGFSLHPRRSSRVPTNTTIQETIPRALPPHARHGFRFYNPLRDPPPYATAKEPRRWQYSFLNIFFGGEDITPDLNGPPLAALYAAEAARAKRGNIQTATRLFVGLVYCRLVRQAGRFLKTLRGHRYCAGLPRSLYDQASLNRWAKIAIQSGNPVTLYIATNYASASVLKEDHPRSLSKFYRNVTKHAAQVGMPIAWGQLSTFYEDGIAGVSLDPTRAFACLYTEYMLTKLPFLAYQIWRASQGELNPEEIARGMKIAHRYYREIREGKKLSIPLTEKKLTQRHEFEHHHR